VEVMNDITVVDLVEQVSEPEPVIIETKTSKKRGKKNSGKF
jgi:hypothetical protein